VTVRDRQIVGGWLQSLPKPAGVLTLENTTGQFLLRVCQRVGLRVPQDIQIIGVDEADECLDCEPHLTSLQMPSERIGEIAMGAMLRYLGYQQPVPPRALYAEGITIIARGSTGLVPMALSNIATALNTIQTETGKGLTAKTVVAQSHVGHTTFYKQFRAATGATPARYLRQKRLDEACRMLKETSANITTIAGMCGFSSANYFAELFRRATGQSPRAYREQWRARSKSDAQPKRPHPS
jgi:LacI family transcriptional regulator